MEYLLTETNLNVLESFALVDTIYAFDFDGTLAPIVNNPDDARMSERTSYLLGKLNDKVPVAIISGRCVSDLRKVLNFKPRYLIGNHGIEGTQSASDLDKIRATCAQWKDFIYRSLLEKKLTDITVEDKEYSLSIHYRNASNMPQAKKTISNFLKELPDARITTGKCVFNILPLGGFNKGQALNKILKDEGYKFAFFIGDDDTDEDVFLYSNSRMFTVRVGESNSSNAKFFLESQPEIEQLLEKLVSFQSTISVPE